MQAPWIKKDILQFWTGGATMIEVNENPATTPSGDAKIKKVSHRDFCYSFANASAQTGM